ncbi:MAG: AarF/UbiB family protein [Porticoccaceae bacterium]|nr:AarF/ABC1/UbiB kinase family protein [Pseudomonadales bacterium]MCP5170951.1 AarF/ABC1/UbiB kinase family protein [Pseudomonadales bacterium]MCP5301811.1 AarF/ABC1/UbiB kinase family protein [Pseudomonadales bacterium]
MTSPSPDEVSPQPFDQKGIVVSLLNRTKKTIQASREFSSGFSGIYVSAAKISVLLNHREHITEAELHDVLSELFDTLTTHPAMSTVRDFTSQMREWNVLPNEQSTEQLIRSVINRVSKASNGLVPDAIVDEFWQFFNELADEPELNGIGEIGIDIARIIVEAYEPLLVKIINQLKDIRSSRTDQLGQVLSNVREVRQDLIIFRRQIRALRHIRKFLDVDPEDYQQQAVVIADMVREFGPFFIKMAQVAAANSDLLPDEISAALAVFQEDVDPMSAEEVESAIRECFGEPSHKRYFNFDASKPLKSGSIASVYVAHRVLNPASRHKLLTPVVVKVGRHNLEREFLIGKTVIKVAILTSQYWAPHGKLAPFLKSWLDQTDIFVEGFNEELDFEQEALNQSKFAERAKFSSGWSVPKVYSAQHRIIEMELIDNSTGLNKAFAQLSGKESRRTRRKVARAYLRALLTHSLIHQEFHGDLHQGNILVNKQANLYFIDWGNSVDLSELWLPAVRYLLAVFLGDAKGVTKQIIAMAANQEFAAEKHRDIENVVEKSFADANIRPPGPAFLFNLIQEGEEGWKKRIEQAMNLTTAITRQGITIQGSYMHLGRSLSAMTGSYMSLYKGLSRQDMLMDAIAVSATFPALTSYSYLWGIIRTRSLKVPL